MTKTGILIIWIKGENKNMKIYIKTFFSDWHEVTKEQYEKWKKHVINNASNKEKAKEIVERRTKVC